MCVELIEPWMNTFDQPKDEEFKQLIKAYGFSGKESLKDLEVKLNQCKQD